MGTYFLFLDDRRFPEGATINGKSLLEVSGVGNTQWTIARSHAQFVSIIEGKGVPEVVSLDHDLTEEHLKHVVGEMKATGQFNYFKFQDTGYQCAEFLCHYCLSKKLAFPRWFVHSYNPIGADNIRRLITQFPHYNLQ